MTPKYRPDIDGLRAIAVLSVLFFHYRIGPFSGGYVGVDIFFVISGYLITTIILREIENRNFSITRFYERRFRRILPALIVTVISALIAGALLFDSNQFEALSKSISLTALFSSNILFYLQSGYFDTPSALKPLLHTWSLAVEEQYYIFFPLILVWIGNWRSKQFVRILIPLALISFIASIFGVYVNSPGTFYLIPTRAWEFLVGSILSIHTLPKIKQLYTRNIITIAGLALIAFSIFTYDTETPFPGFAALAPTLGTAFIIYAGTTETPWINRILSLRPLVFIGLISYSLYLWHWPILVFTKYYTITGPNGLTTTLMLIATAIMAIITWRYVETPYRKKRLLAERKQLIVTSLIASAGIALIGAIILFNHGFPNRYVNDPAHQITDGDPEWKHWEACENIEARFNRHQELCSIGKPGNAESFIVWGDSHARALASAINLRAKQNGASGRIATRSACLPLISVGRPNDQQCRGFNTQVLSYLTTKPEIGTVILAGRWALSANGSRYKREEGPDVRLIDTQVSENNFRSNTELFEIGLNRTIERLHQMGKKIVLVAPIPEVGFNVPASEFIAHITGRDVNQIIAPRLNEYHERRAPVQKIFTQLAQQRQVRIVDPSILLCDKQRCIVTRDDTAMYRDDDHLSTFGSKQISAVFNPVFIQN